MFHQNFDTQVKALQKMQEKATKEALRLNQSALKKWQDLDMASQLKRVEMPDMTFWTAKNCPIGKACFRKKRSILGMILLALATCGVGYYFYSKRKMEKLWEDSASDRYEFINDEEMNSYAEYEEAGIDALEDALDEADKEA